MKNYLLNSNAKKGIPIAIYAADKLERIDKDGVINIIWSSEYKFITERKLDALVVIFILDNC